MRHRCEGDAAAGRISVVVVVVGEEGLWNVEWMIAGPASGTIDHGPSGGRPIYMTIRL